MIMNRPEEERAVAPRWILRCPRLDPKALRNARNLKSLDPTFGRQEYKWSQNDHFLSISTEGLRPASQPVATVNSQFELTVGSANWGKPAVTESTGRGPLTRGDVRYCTLGRSLLG